ncbi:minor capsid protein [Streptosporangium minutum]|uniref:minor capsid protein n=1 Tax=Streptosporangium minutum TaxID=569862 RepID=UPI000A365BC7|nr:minor capsid protein [Streptosporangium minutum]
MSDWTTDLLTALAEQLHNAGAGVWRPAGPSYTASETAIVLGRLPTAPDRAIALQPYGVDQDGDDPVNTDGTLGVQFRMRGTPDIRVLNGIAEDVFDALQGLKLPAVGVLLMTRRIQAPMGSDGNGRWERADSYRLLTHHPTTHRPG